MENIGIIYRGMSPENNPCKVFEIDGVGKIYVEDKTAQNTDEKTITHHRYLFENAGAQQWWEDNFVNNK